MSKELILNYDEVINRINEKGIVKTEVLVNPYLWDYAKKFQFSSAPDVIKLSSETDDRLYQTFINKDLNSMEETPADILFSNTIPLKDVLIEIDERDKTVTDMLGFVRKGELVKYRIVILDNFDVDKKPCQVGYMFAYVGNFTMCYSLCIQKGYDYIFVDQVGQSDYKYTIVLPVNIFTNTWYAIQLSLLHPRIKQVVKTISKIPYHIKSRSKEKERKVKYIKLHTIDITDVEKITHEKKGITRRCLVWYVIGHWRHYSNGKDVFIQGYWKGELRDIKQNLDDRERVIDEELLIEGGRPC